MIGEKCPLTFMKVIIAEFNIDDRIYSLLIHNETLAGALITGDNQTVEFKTVGHAFESCKIVNLEEKKTEIRDSVRM